MVRDDEEKFKRKKSGGEMGQGGFKVVLESGRVAQQRGIQAKRVERRRMAKMAPIMGWLQKAVGRRGQR